MSKMFTAINRKTGEKWKPKIKGDFLMMYDSGYLAECHDRGWDGVWVTPLDQKEWRVEYRPALQRKIERFLNKV